MDLATSEEGERNLQYFQRQKLPWLQTFLQERGIQTSSEGKCKRKAKLVALAFNAHSVKLRKVSEGESKNENLIMAELLATDAGVLPDPASIMSRSRNLSLFPEVTFPDTVSVRVTSRKCSKTRRRHLGGVIFQYGGQWSGKICVFGQSDCGFQGYIVCLCRFTGK